MPSFQTQASAASEHSAYPPAHEAVAPFAAQGRAWRLILAVVLLNFLAFVLCALVLNRLRDMDIEQTRIQSRNLAHAIDQNLANSIEKLDLSLYALTKELEHSLRAGALDHRHIIEHIDQQFDRHPESLGNDLIVSDAKGRVVLTGSRQRGDFTAVSLVSRPYFQALRDNANSGLYVSKAMRIYITGTWSIVLARRYNLPDGRFGGVVVAPVALENLRQTLSRYDIGEQGYAVIRDRDLGLIVRHPPAVNGVALQPGSLSTTALTYQIVSSGVAEKSYAVVNGFDQRRRINTLMQASKAPFIIIVGLDEEENLRNWRQALWTCGFILCLFSATTIIVARRDYRYWCRAAHGAQELVESKLSLEHALSVLQQRDESLRVAEQIGGIGVFSLQFPEGLWRRSPRLEELLGIGPEYAHDLKGWASLIHEADRESTVAYLEYDILSCKQNFDRTYRIVRGNDKRICWMHVWGQPEIDSDGQVQRLNGIYQDISLRVLAEKNLRLSREAFLHASEGILITDRQGIILEANPAFTRMSGYALDELVDRRPNLLKSGLHDKEFYAKLWQTLLEKGLWEGELHNRQKNGGLYIQMTRISSVRDEEGGITHFIALASDVTELRETQHRIEYLAYHDRLTDLPNRSMLADRLQLAIAQADRRHELLGVCYLDLDGFKPINDEWGHDTGDQVLIEVSHRLQLAVRAGDTVARIGGDEFVVLLNNIQDEREIHIAVQRMLESIAQPYVIGAMKASMTISIGATIYPHDAEDADTLLRHADQAMYTAKRTGKNRLHMFDPEGDRRMQDRHDKYIRMVEGFNRREFCLHYQPQVRMDSGEVVGVEALLRWQHPEFGLVHPEEFLQVIDNVDFSVRFGEWILHQALRQMRAWMKQGLTLPVSVNISTYHLHSPDFVARLAAMLEEYPLVVPGMLELEILESAAMNDLDAAVRVVEACTDLGVDFALDDFGIGLSSLTCLRRLPTKYLKIDRTFVVGMLNDMNDRTLVGSVISLAHDFGREVIAEGVESVAHGDALVALGCELAQGFCIAPPMPPEQFAKWLKGWQAPDSWKVKPP